MMEIERPKIETASLSPDGRYGRFVAEPLERGFGITLGNSLRRVLLSSLPGVAVTSVKIDGVVHEFSTIEGVKEDVTEIVLNLKGIAAKLYTDGPKTVRVEAVGPCEVTADNIKQGDDIEILNPEWHIATLGEGGKLVMELTFDKGRGYVPAERNKQAIIEKNDINTLPVDSIYTPVLKVNYNVESTRVGQAIDYDMLHAAVDVHGGDDRLDHVREYRRALPPSGVLFAAAKAHIFADAKLKRNLVQARLADKLRAQTRHAPLRQLRLTVIQEVRRHDAEYRVAQKLQPLIAPAGRRMALVGIGAVGQCRFEKLCIFKLIADFFFQTVHSAFASVLSFMYSMFASMSEIMPDSAKLCA